MTIHIIRSEFSRQKYSLHLKPVVLLAFLFSTFSTAFAQDKPVEKDVLKGFRFGLKIAPAFSWLSPQDSKRMVRDGVNLKFAYGLAAEFRLNKSAYFLSGLEINYTGGAVSFPTTDSVFYDAAEYLTEYREDQYKRMFVLNRNYRIRYVDIPLCIKLRTPEIGQLTYFGLIGTNLSIRSRVIANDVGTLVVSETDTNKTEIVRDYEIKDIDVTNATSFFRLGLNAGIGAEYALAGSTALCVSMNFHQGFTNVLKEGNSGLSTVRTNLSILPSARSHFFQINIGILF